MAGDPWTTWLAQKPANLVGIRYSRLAQSIIFKAASKPNIGEKWQREVEHHEHL